MCAFKRKLNAAEMKTENESCKWKLKKLDKIWKKYLINRKKAFEEKKKKKLNQQRHML